MKTRRLSHSKNRIVFAAFDPMDNALLSTVSMPYNPLKCAHGYYRKYYLAMKKWLPEIFPELGIRAPIIEVGYQP